MGALSVIKGYDLLASTIQHSEEADLPIDFAIIGTTAKPLPKSTRALVTGPYQNELLPQYFAQRAARLLLVLIASARNVQLHVVRLSRDGVADCCALDGGLRGAP